ncbi:hypothetical protein PoB_006110100 [Plakobranchus ocellatus]|uniref:Uncharacterized protein n=1 Tax=Plakobranchus ocellatus TaxID=259542 RepID=A0AAV4CRW5_9GAST|nr:hypothetical protein PoB_006110100 [Plakobranchus ocellatus]
MSTKQQHLQKTHTYRSAAAGDGNSVFGETTAKIRTTPNDHVYLLLRRAEGNQLAAPRMLSLNATHA